MSAEPEDNYLLRGNTHMKRIINHLIQIQELREARDEQVAAGSPTAQLTELDNSIEHLQDSLPDGVRSRFVRLQKRLGNPVAPVFHGVCAGCAMTLPVSQVHDVRAATEIQHCPNCGRFLYTHPEDMPRRPSRPSRRGAVQPGIARFSSPALMLPQIKANSRDEAIDTICKHLADNNFVDHVEPLTRAALRRESLASTAVSHGIAFPHVRGIEGGGLTMALATSRKGLHFGPGRSLTRLVFFMVIPTAASAFYLKLLSGLCTSLSEKEARDELLQVDDPEILWKTLFRLTRKTIR